VIDRRTFCGAPALLLRQSATKRKPNLLFLIADDHAAYVAGHDGNRLAQTPNIDRLSAEGVRFAAHYCNSPVCTPSRQSFFTGQLPHMAGVTRLATSLDPEKPTLAKQLKLAGYQTAVFGKMHFNRPAAPGLYGFDVMMTESELNRAWRNDVKPQTREWKPFQTPAQEWLNAAKAPYPATDEQMLGSYCARQAIRYLEENRNKPFALWVSFQEPHSPFNFPNDDRERFAPGKMPVPRVGPEDAWQIPLIFRDLNDNEKRGITAAYYTSAAFLDRNVGRVFHKLRQLGLDENTMVVYTADHGYCLGHHGRFEKHCGYDPALRVPLIVRWPNRFEPSEVRDMTEHIDLTPTILECMGANPVPVQHGQSLMTYLQGGRAPRPRTHIFSEYLENEDVYIRTEKWKLNYSTGRRKREDGYATDNPTPGRTVRLYDLKQDPGEFANVAAQNPKVVAELEALALARFRSTHPDADREPANDPLDFYLRPRDA
jgi:choline-sulfatase